MSKLIFIFGSGVLISFISAKGIIHTSRNNALYSSIFVFTSTMIGMTASVVIIQEVNVIGYLAVFIYAFGVGLGTYAGSLDFKLTTFFDKLSK